MNCIKIDLYQGDKRTTIATIPTERFPAMTGKEFKELIEWFGKKGGKPLVINLDDSINIRRGIFIEVHP